MRLLGFVLLYCWCSLAYASTEVRVLLDEQAGAVEFQSEYPVSFSTSFTSIELNHPKTKYKIFKKKRSWHVLVESLQKIQEHRLQGKVLSIDSRVILWGDTRVTFPVSLVYSDSKYQFIGRIDLETYLRGVVPHEMPASWPLEALKAQAVASRSYVFWKMDRQKNRNYDVRSSIFDQVFKVKDAGSVSSRVKTALRITQGQVLFDKKNNIMKSYFHSDCGGHTESSNEIWGRPDMASQGVKDKFCGQRRRSHWVSEWSSHQIISKVSKEFFLPENLRLKDVIVRTKLKSQRVKEIDLMFTNGILKRLSGEDARRLLGYSQLKSTLFDVTKKQNSWVFRGKGFGHGVGMCQWGARAMASAGQSYQKILAHYYSLATLDLYAHGKKDLVSLLDL